MEHFLITRFNVPVPGWENDKAGVATRNEDWMQHRLTLFSRYCVPTISGQSQNNFKWLIYCATDTRDIHLKEIRSMIEKISHAKIRLVPHFEALKKDLVEQLAASGSAYVITSRVDNDDGLGIDYIRMVQDHFAPQDKVLINLSGGVLYDAHKRVLTELPNVQRNHFSSLMERNDGTGTLLTIMGFAHHDPPDTVRVRHVKCRFAWLKTIHTRNLKSRTIGIPVLSKKALVHYTLDKKDIPVSLMNTLAYLMFRAGAVLKQKLFTGRN